MRLLPFLQAPLPSCLSFLDRPTAGWSCTDLRGCGLDHLQLQRLRLLFDQHGLRTHFICHAPPLFHGPGYTKLIPSSPSDSAQSTRERSSRSQSRTRRTIGNCSQSREPRRGRTPGRTTAPAFGTRNQGSAPRRFSPSFGPALWETPAAPCSYWVALIPTVFFCRGPSAHCLHGSRTHASRASRLPWGLPVLR